MARKYKGGKRPDPNTAARRAYGQSVKRDEGVSVRARTRGEYPPGPERTKARESNKRDYQGIGSHGKAGGREHLGSIKMQRHGFPPK